MQHQRGPPCRPVQVISAFRGVIQVAQTKVLVVDDDEAILKLVTSTLQLENFLGIPASSCEAALEILKRELVDCMVLDVLLPNMTGIDLCQKLKKTPLYRHIPVIFLSVKGKVMDKVEGLRAGADDYVSKPFNPDELFSRIKAVLHKTSVAIHPVSRLPNLYAAELQFEHETDLAGAKALGFLLTQLDLFQEEYPDRVDDVITKTGNLLLGTISKAGTIEDFLAQVNQDQFLVLTKSPTWEQLKDAVSEGYARLRPTFFKKGLASFLKKIPEGVLEMRSGLLSSDLSAVSSFREIIFNFSSLVM